MNLQELPTEVKFGIAGGIFYALASYILYLAGPAAYSDAMAGSIAFLAIVAVAIYAGYHKKQKQDNVISFSEATQTIFLSFLIISFIWVIFYYMLFNVIDPDFNERVFEHQLEMIEQLEEDEELSPEDREQFYDEPIEVTLWSALQYLVSYAIMGLILALIGGGFLKNDNFLSQDKLGGDKWQ